VNVRARAWTAEAVAWGALQATVALVAFSIALGQAAAVVCFVAFLAALARRQTRLRLPGVGIFALAFIALGFLTSWRGGGAPGLWRRAGELCWWLLLPVAATLASTAERRRRLLRAFLAGTTVLALKVLVWHPWAAWRNPAGGFLTALIDQGSMTAGQMLMMGVIAVVALILGAGRRAEGAVAPADSGAVNRALVWWPVLLALQSAALLINFKRGSWFCAALVGGAVVLRRTRWPVWLALAAAVLGLVLTPPIRTRLDQLRGEWDRDAGGRLTMWTRVAPALIRARPLGIGYGNLTNEMMRRIAPRIEKNRDHLHSNPVQVLVETGWPGLALYLVWMLGALWNGLRWVRRAGRAGEAVGPPVPELGRAEQGVALACLLMFAGLLLNGLVEYNFGDAELLMVAAVLMGVMAGGDQAAAVAHEPGRAGPEGAGPA